MSTPTDVRDVMTEWVRRCGPSFLDEPRRVRAVLHDAVPGSPDRAALVTAALEGGVARRIQGTPPDRLADEIDRLTAELTNRLGMRRADAAWAVHTVAGALGAPVVARRPRRTWLVVAAVGAALTVTAAVTIVVVVLGRGPVPPGNPRATAGENGVVLDWAAAGDAARYEVHRDGALLAETADTGYVDSDVEGGTEYRYTVRTVDGSGKRSEPSSFASVTVALAAPEIRTPTVQGSTVTLTWAPVAGADHYEVVREGTPVADDLTGTTVTDGDAGAGRRTYVVSAVDDDGDGGESSSSVTAVVEPWGEMQPIASALPELFPPTPEDSLPGPVAPHRCSSSDPSEGAREGVTCTFDNEMVVIVELFASREAVATDLENLNQEEITTWTCGSVVQGKLAYGLRDGGGPYEVFTFDDPALQLFDLYAEWPGHTAEQLYDEFLVAGVPCS